MLAREVDLNSPWVKTTRSLTAEGLKDIVGWWGGRVLWLKRIKWLLMVMVRKQR